MNKINHFFDKLLETVPGGVFGIISMLIGISSLFISILNYPGYSMVLLYISNLGIGPGLSAPIFNIGIIVTGFIAIPFYVYMGRVMKTEGVNEKYRKNSITLAIIGCISLSLVGCFPAYNLILLLFHGSFAALFFLSSLICSIAFSYLMWNDTRFPKVQSYFGVVVGGIYAIYCVTLQPIIEWVCFFALVSWVLETSIFMLVKTL